MVLGGLAMLLSLAACAAPAEAVAISPDNAPAAAVETIPGVAVASPPAPVAPVEKPALLATPAITGPVPATPLVVSNNGEVVTIPLSAVADVVNTEFSIAVNDRSLDFMAYVLDGELFVRASACPPCSYLAYTLDDGKLLCEACDARFDALTGEGIDGACVDYPKAAVAYEVSGDLVTMKVADLVRAWDETEAEGDGPVVAPIIVAEEPETEAPRPSCCG